MNGVLFGATNCGRDIFGPRPNDCFAGPSGLSLGSVPESESYAFLPFDAVQREQNALYSFLYKFAVRCQRIKIDLGASHHFEMKFDSGIPSILAHSEYRSQKYEYMQRLMMFSVHSFF